MSQIKILLALGLLAIALYSGFANAPRWIIPLLVVPFTAAYIQGTWYLWDDLFRQRNLKLYRSLLITYLIQAEASSLLQSGVILRPVADDLLDGDFGFWWYLNPITQLHPQLFHATMP